MIRYYIFLALVFLPLHSFEDDDIDGVENSQDLCPDTSFEETVGENGCPENKNYLGELTLILGSDFNFDDTTTTDYTFFSNYKYNKWDFSIYNSKQSSIDNNNNEIQSTGDVYLSSGYNFSRNNLDTKLTLGIKIPTGSSEISTEEKDYFASINMNYPLNENFVLFS